MQVNLELTDVRRQSDPKFIDVLQNIRMGRYTDQGNKMSRVMRKPMFWFLTWSDTNQVVQLLKMARGLKFRI